MAPCATNHDTSNAACTNLPKIKNKNNSHFITIKKNDEKCERERESDGEGHRIIYVTYWIVKSMLSSNAHFMPCARILWYKFLIREEKTHSNGLIVNSFVFRCQFVPVSLNEIRFLFKFVSHRNTLAIGFCWFFYVFLWWNWWKSGSVNQVASYCVRRRRKCLLAIPLNDFMTVPRCMCFAHSTRNN